MISFSKFIAEQNSSIKAQASSSAVSQKLFPELSPKKRPKRITLGQKIQHRRQKDRAKGASIDNKGTVNLKESKAKPFTITNTFGGVKYKNIKMANHSTPIVPSEISKPIHHNYLQKNPEYYNPTDITASKERVKEIGKAAKDIASGTIKKTSDAVSTVANGVKGVGAGVVSTGNKIGASASELIYKKMTDLKDKKKSSLDNVDEPTMTASPNPKAPVAKSKIKPLKLVAVPKPDPIVHDTISI